MAFDRNEFGMNSDIPFIKIADRVEVTVNLKTKPARQWTLKNNPNLEILKSL